MATTQLYEYVTYDTEIHVLFSVFGSRGSNLVTIPEYFLKWLLEKIAYSVVS